MVYAFVKASHSHYLFIFKIKQPYTGFMHKLYYLLKFNVAYTVSVTLSKTAQYTKTEILG